MHFLLSFLLGGLLPTFVVRALLARLLARLTRRGPESLPAGLPARDRVAALLKKTQDPRSHAIAANLLSLLLCTLIFGLLRSGWTAPLAAFGLVLVPQCLWLALDLWQLKGKQP